MRETEKRAKQMGDKRRERADQSTERRVYEPLARERRLNTISGPVL
jgi:hypothetical protein